MGWGSFGYIFREFVQDPNKMSQEEGNTLKLVYSAFIILN